MNEEKDLSDRRKLFEVQLPKWEAYIFRLSNNLMYTRPIDRGLVGVDDIQNDLRMALWRAIEKYDESKGTKLSSWIIALLNQSCSLIVQAHYNRQPRDTKGKIQVLIPIAEDRKVANQKFLDIVDPVAEWNVLECMEDDWFRKKIDLVFKVLSNKKSINEKLTFKMMLSGDWANDKAISEELHVNWAKVGDVRLKARIVFAILDEIPIRSFTSAKSAPVMARQLWKRLKPHVEELPEVIMEVTKTKQVVTKVGVSKRIANLLIQTDPIIAYGRFGEDPTRLKAARRIDKERIHDNMIEGGPKVIERIELIGERQEVAEQTDLVEEVQGTNNHVDMLEVAPWR